VTPADKRACQLFVDSGRQHDRERGAEQDSAQRSACRRAWNPCVSRWPQEGTGRSAQREGRALLMGLLNVALHSLKIMRSLIGFAFADEINHLRTANDITGVAISANTIPSCKSALSSLACIRDGRSRCDEWGAHLLPVERS
jgi:hypothetical protein